MGDRSPLWSKNRKAVEGWSNYSWRSIAGRVGLPLQAKRWPRHGGLDLDRAGRGDTKAKEDSSLRQMVASPVVARLQIGSML